MAIKKGAFDLYTQERQLPSKNSVYQNKANHFFDDVDKTIDDNLPQKQPSSNSLSSPIEKPEKTVKDGLIIGSQLVHKQFTDSDPKLIDPLSLGTEQIRKDDFINGSQLVHKQFTDSDPKLIDPLSLGTEKIRKDDFINGSQLVYKQFTDSDPKLIDPLSLGTEQIRKDDFINGSQSKLETPPRICFSKLVGNQREIIIALYKNMKINKSDTTDELNLESISKLTGINQKSLKNTLFRLSDAGIIARADQKIGRGGWVKYQLNAHIISEIQQKGIFR